jgi:glutamate-1-semialdehyde aminotransferase/aryl-alcohol dehydrogenase-like predicted oxidoreductase
MNLRNKLILGCAQSNSNYGLNKNNKFFEVFDYALKLKWKYFDTSPAYKNNHRYIQKLSQVENVKIILKCSFDGVVDKDYKKRITHEIEEAISKNGHKNIYSLLIHNPVLPLNEKKWSIVSKVLKSYKKRDIIKKIGVSVYSRFELDQILNIFTPEIVQFPLNPFNQSFEDKNYLKKIKSKGIELHARSVFLQGLLTQEEKNIDGYFSIWLEHLNKYKNFIKKNKLNKLKACLIYLNQNDLVDKFVIGIDNKDQFLKILGEIKKLPKKKYDFSELAITDDYLIDPRYWDKKNVKKNSNISYWHKVKGNVLNGGMLLSKRPDQFLPGGWPSFYKKAKNCFIVDNLNKRYLDFSLMGVGTNILGYANEKVNNAIKGTINNGSTSTLNSNLDFKLTEKLIKMHPWAKIATYARTGAEANAIAVRIARAYTKKDEIAICGYHGWHDWYISTNLKNNKNLDEIHLPGLSTIGIPKKLRGITHPFKYNDTKGFKKLIKNNPKIGVVFMEVERNQKPRISFLKEIRKITTQKKIVLIFDECTSGFRETFGGLHKKYKINPDIAVFGKALGNGIPITSVIGTKEIMKSGEESFISSTFWTDSTGPAAAIVTLEEMEKQKSWIKISKTGKKIKHFWRHLSKKYDVPIVITGLDALPSFKFKSKMHLYLKTFLTQEMLRKKILATNSVYCCIDHDKYLKTYFSALEKIFYEVGHFLRGKDIMKSLKYPVCKNGLYRLN